MFLLPGFPLLPSSLRQPGAAWGFGPRVGQVARSAFRAGQLVGVLLRSSRRSFSSVVLVCFFLRPRPAARFAALWAGRLGVSVSVRRSGGCWSVSVPVALRSSRWPANSGLVLWVLGLGGCRGFSAWLRSSGLGVA